MRGRMWSTSPAVDAVAMSAFRDPPTADTITYRCPVCGAIATIIGACPGCGRAPDPRASRLPGLDASLVELASEVHRSRAVFERALATWQSAEATRDTLVSTIIGEPVRADRAVSGR